MIKVREKIVKKPFLKETKKEHEKGKMFILRIMI